MTSTEDASPSVGTSEINFVEVKLDKEQADSKFDNAAKNGRMSVFCKKCCLCFDSITTSKNPLPENPSICQRIRYTFLCPPHGIIGSYITTIFIFAILYAVFWSLLGESALPRSNIFGLWVLFICCIIGGYIVQFIKLPPLLGMLIVGIILKNVPYIDIGQDIDPTWSGILRNTALTVILIRAGLGLDPEALKKLSFAVVRLAFSPCLTETVVAAIVSHFLLGLPWIWGFMLGFVIAAVSPAVVVPCLLHLQDWGYGIDKGIPTLVIAAASIDDVLAITGFGVVLGIAFAEGNIVWSIFKGPLEALLGIVLGAIFGVFLWYIPAVKQKNRLFQRGFILFAVGLVGVLGCPRLEIPGTGPLLCLTVAFVAAVGWRRQNDVESLNTIMNATAILWLIFEPLLFGLIGTEVDVSKLNGETIGYGIATLVVGLSFRTIVAFFAVFRTNLNLKEKFFVGLAWLPKATVQAAIGSVALSTARDKKKPVFERYGLTILEVAVLVILITAPIGAALVMLTGPRLLNRTDPSSPTHEKIHQDEQQEMEVQTATESINTSL
ncbi:SLC9B1_2 [Acanthosepion pharaonis]|uniref:SLC9B1_2 n=1 Tax=Acanthosepion pharaonis TaxID=158019 RepID=A0A812CEW0_ACAPH|nr:SLC9B1_2 [Sepia pharaonis]